MGVQLDSNFDKYLNAEYCSFRSKLYELCCQVNKRRGKEGLEHYAFPREPLYTPYRIHNSYDLGMILYHSNFHRIVSRNRWDLWSRYRLCKFFWKSRWNSKSSTWEAQEENSIFEYIFGNMVYSCCRIKEKRNISGKLLSCKSFRRAGANAQWSHNFFHIRD